MNKRIFSLICVVAVVLVFVFTAQTASISWNVGAEDETVTTRKSSNEEPYNEPSTSASTTTQPPMPTTSSTTKKEEEPTTKPTESSTDPTTPPKPTDPANPTNPTDPPHVSETQGTVPSSEPGSEKDTTKAPSKPTTTKKGGKNNTTTTRRGGGTYTTTKRYVPLMTVPQVENTTIEGTTLSPLDAYFERISGDSNTFAENTAAETTQPEPEEMETEHKPLSTIAIVAICLGGFALVTVGLTAAFAIRNKHAADEPEDTAADYEYDAYGDSDYAQPDPQDKQARPQVDESDSFTVVSLDDNDYTD